MDSRDGDGEGGDVVLPEKGNAVGYKKRTTISSPEKAENSSDR
jgi:hypothetical protein